MYCAALESADCVARDEMVRLSRSKTNDSSDERKHMHR